MHPERTALSPRQRMVVIIMDVLLLLEMTLCIYLSHEQKETMVLSFLGSYVPLMLVTLLSARFVIKRMDRTPDAEKGKA